MLIDVPRNIQVGDVPEHIKPIVKPTVKPTALSELKLAEAKALLSQAKKPVLYVGGGVGWQTQRKRSENSYKLPKCLLFRH